ncbi:hypothetical protein PCASD_24236 [Puccinia coronata f. sp. avenae]|uniref:Phosphatidate cytidylyltransferase, mitochondrial n=1 Tax=Puccinia coronata f. sp. avenae TaxID=200324 RepID=A0A2N5THI0_9BASI|nr:hypothetical protein PCASD_25329 [Puccinia coronata f. sp. avenae]PLW24955.1 hypothetical protein PCASD_24236 [Puccinia coronata f. sp. avenae]
MGMMLSVDSPWRTSVGVSECSILARSGKSPESPAWHRPAPSNPQCLPIRFAFVYGSAVFPQKSRPLGRPGASPPPIRDFVFPVSHPGHWHSINLHHNPHHYSLPARLVNSPAIASLQEHALGAGLWFNLRANVIKYGVVSVDTLCNDLMDWNTLCLSGRMHKPIDILRDHPRARLAQHANLVPALRTALLLLPERFDALVLFRPVAGLSYTGDFQMRFAENPHKVNNTVAGQTATINCSLI